MGLPKTKTCSICNQIKPLKEFRQATGERTWVLFQFCKSCDIETRLSRQETYKTIATLAEQIFS